MCIKLEFDTLMELKEFARNILGVPEVEQVVPVVQQPPVQSTQQPSVQEVQQPSVQEVQQPPVQQTNVPTATGYTPQQLAGAAMQLKDTGRLMELPPILEQFGVSAVTQLKPEQYAGFANALVQMGVKL